MRYTVESWSPDHGSSSEAAMTDASEPPKLDVELPVERWAPITPSSPGADVVVFVDGVRRVDANIWIERERDLPTLGLCAVYAAGAVLTDGSAASMVEAVVDRGLFTSAVDAEDLETRNGTYRAHLSPGETAEDLWLAIQAQMGRQEGEIARRFDAPLVVVDGPLSHGSHPEGVVGYIKRQHTNYLPPELRHILLDLPTGRRTPMFLIGGRSNRYSWYQRLGIGAGPGSGLVRCEMSAVTSVTDAIATADRVAATLPRYASEPHKDGRAPQNLYPIAGLERALRRRLGDPQLMERALRLASR